MPFGCFHTDLSKPVNWCLGSLLFHSTNQAAIWGAVLSIPIAIGLKFIPGIPFINQMGLTAIGTMIIIIIISYQTGKGVDDPKGIKLHKGLFTTSPAFNISAFIICILTAVLYAVFW